MTTVFEINRTILRNQGRKLAEAQVEEALAACPSPERVGLARARLELACWLSDCWPMVVCEELAEALLPEPDRRTPAPASAAPTEADRTPGR